MTSRRNGRLGIDPRAPAPLTSSSSPSSSSSPQQQQQLPPIVSRHHQQQPLLTHAKLQQQERQALREAFCERLRANHKLGAFALLQPLNVTTDELHGRRSAGAVEPEGAEEDSITFVTRLALALEPSAPLAARFVASLVANIRALVHAKLHAEAAASALVSHTSGATGSPRSPHVLSDIGMQDEMSSSSRSRSSSEDESDDDRDDSEQDGQDSGASGGTRETQSTSITEDSRSVSGAHSSTQRDRSADVPHGSTFRTSLRCRRFPPSRVPAAEHIVTTCAYTPFDHSKTPSDLSSIHLTRTGGTDGSRQWLVVQFPKPKPKMSRSETDALIQWAQRKLTALEGDPPQIPETYADRVTHFHRKLALFEHICYEMSRLVFDRCPTTARFIHGLFVELVDTALRTVTNADRESRINEQRHKNVHQDLQRLTTKLDAVRCSLAGLEATLRKRQCHLLSERERIIRQRKKLNILICADQVLIRNVAGLIQHLLDLSDELITAVTVDDPHGLIGGQSKRVFMHNNDDKNESTLQFNDVDALYELVKNKYESLRGVQEALALAEKAHKDADDLETDRVVILDLDTVVTATEDFKSALHRLNRLISTKSPDSIVGWEAQELWDQALFIPPHEDIQDLDRDVLRLCKYVEASILRQRHQVRELRCHASVQTDISACATFHQRERANGFISFLPLLPLESDHPFATAMSCQQGGGPPPQHLAEEHRELLEKFLPPEFRRFIHDIPSNYAPRQLSLGVTHSIISYLFNEMWLLVREEYLLQPRRFSIAGAATSSTVPVARIHEYVYRIYLLHFREPAYVTSRLLDLLVSASRLDTQSCKVLLFCRLLNLPGVDPLSQDAFWFVLKTMHILQRACTSARNYFHLDASGENEFIPQVSATEALNILFRGAPNDVMKRLRLRLAGLASVYGTIWIPAPNIIEFVIEEWKTAQDNLRMRIMEQIAQEQKAATTLADKHLPTFAAFVRVFSGLNMKVQRVEAAQAYHQLLSNSRQMRKHGASDVAIVDADGFVQMWLQLVLHAVNQAQQQRCAPAEQHHSSTTGDKSVESGSGIHFGPPSDAFVSANRHLSFCFLKATWQQTKNDFIRSLDVEFHDIGLQVRLIQQMDNIVSHKDLAAQVGWSSFQQLIAIMSTGKVASRC